MRAAIFNGPGSITAGAGRPLRKGPILAIVLTSYTMIVLDISIVITALPEIHRTLDFSATALSWVQNAYLLAFGGLLLLGARLGDLVGRRRMLMIGLGLFTAASVGVGAAQSESWLIAARAVQGAGAAVLAASTLALLQTSFDEGAERTRAVSSYAAVAGVAATVGLVIGGMFAGWLSWRVGFFINLPIGAAMILATPRFLPETPPQPGRVDVTGALTSTVGMTALVFGIVRAADAGWGEAAATGAIAVGVLLLVSFVALQRRTAEAIMPLRLFASRERAGAYAARLLFLGAMAPFWFFTTQWLQSVAGYSPVEAGLAFLPVTVPNFAAAMLVPRLTRRYGNPTVLVAGLLVSAAGMAWLSRLGPDTAYSTGIAIPMGLVGFGQGGSLGPLTAGGLVGVSGEDAGAAGGVTNVAHQIGGSLGLALLVTVFAAADSGSLTGGALLAHRISAALTAATVLLLLALAVAVVVLPCGGPRRANRSAAPMASPHDAGSP
ncbi:MAG: major facilitator superfamily 1 [Solirubrobacterales bacterium]|nr:major facilitator superfamily 1 [Solirubrobacterales bacterium]